MDCLVVSYLRDWNVLNLTWAVAIERRATTIRGPCSVTGRSFAARLQRHRARLRGWRGGSSLTVPALLRLVPSSSTSSSSSLSHKMRVVVSMGTRMASEKKRERQSKAGVSSPSFFNRRERERARESGNTCFYYNGRKAATAAAAAGSDDNDQPRVVSRDKVRLFSKSIYVNWN